MLALRYRNNNTGSVSGTNEISQHYWHVKQLRFDWMTIHAVDDLPTDRFSKALLTSSNCFLAELPWFCDHQRGIRKWPEIMYQKQNVGIQTPHKSFNVTLLPLVKQNKWRTFTNLDCVKYRYTTLSGWHCRASFLYARLISSVKFQQRQSKWNWLT